MSRERLWRSLARRIRNRARQGLAYVLLGFGAAQGSLPMAPDSPAIERVSEIRQKLLAEHPPTAAERERQVAQWPNWWRDWLNWRDWPNFWRNWRNW